VRIGLEFNRGGAGRALSIIQNQLPQLPGVANPPIGREVAERVLTENVANVFDFSESQAPVFGFDRTECIVRDHVVLHYQDGECIGQLNPAVISVATISDTGVLEVVSEDGQFTSRPNRLYQATIVQSNTTRTVIFASMMAEDEGPSAPAESDFRHAHVVTANSGPGQSRQSGTLRNWTPQQLRQAYNVPDPQAGSKPAGTGTTVAIIGVYHYAQAQPDLNTWAKRFGITPITLNIVNQAGVIRDDLWAMGTSIAVQMVNTVSPGAKVYLIEAKSPSQADIRTAMQTAVTLGADIISMAFGADETYSQDYGVPLFTSNAEVIWIAAAGESGYPTFPATHPNVLAVGGTTLSSVSPRVETAWSAAATGISMYEKMPSYQMIPSVRQRNTTAYRSIPDVAFSADPQYGVQVYSNGFWYVTGGASVSTGLFTGIMALVMEARKAQNLPPLRQYPNTTPELHNALYQLMSSHGGPTNSTILNDVVTGSSSAGRYPAGPGYDIATGLGSINVEQFVDYMSTWRR
jgi:subtilase family serine protease